MIIWGIKFKILIIWRATKYIYLFIYKVAHVVVYTCATTLTCNKNQQKMDTVSTWTGTATCKSCKGLGIYFHIPHNKRKFERNGSIRWWAQCTKILCQIWFQVCVFPLDPSTSFLKTCGFFLNYQVSAWIFWFAALQTWNRVSLPPTSTTTTTTSAFILSFYDTFERFIKRKEKEYNI